jgi:alpha-N-arabinofuranosidase
VLPTDVSDSPGQKFFANAVLDDESGEIILKVVNGSDKPADVAIKLAGAKVDIEGKAIVLAGTNLHDENKISLPAMVKPVESALAGSGNNFTQTFQPWSLTILRVKTQ